MKQSETKSLTDFLDKYGVRYRLEGDAVIVGDDLYLHSNQLTSLPESFGNLKVGGYLSLSYNQLTSTPSTSRMIGQIIEKDWCFIDGTVREVTSRKRLNGLTLLKTPFDYIAGDGQVWAHGKTIEDAVSDHAFKLLESNPDELKSLDVNEPMSIPEAVNVYRAVTRSCREGVRQWMQGRDLPETVSVTDIASLTKGAYGSDRFCEFFGVMNRPEGGK